MNSEALTSQAPNATLGPSEADAQSAKAIEQQGWWQGSIVSDAELRSRNGGLPLGYSHWVLATQTCNLYNVNFATIHSVEWVGAREIDTLGQLASGVSPRRIHCQAVTARNAEQLDTLCLDLDVQARYWSDRRMLEQLAPLPVALRDGDHPKERMKDAFVGWLARSYTRLELANDLVKAFQDSKIEDIIGKVVKAHHDHVYGVFLEISDEEENPVVYVEPPCMVELTFVVYDPEHERSVQQTLNEVLRQQVPNPKYVPGPNVSRNIDRKHVPDKFGIDCEYAVRPMEQFTAKDMNNCVRYSFLDHLSDSSHAAG